MSSRSYPHVVNALLTKPWAITPEALAAVVEIVQHRVHYGPLLAEEREQRLEAARSRQSRQTADSGGGAAVLAMHGAIFPRASSMDLSGGGVSLEDFQHSFRGALADPDVGSIVLDVDSPGGTADLVPETAALIRSARGRKPIFAVANTMAASAAYWIASAADEVVVSPSGLVGSIGVYAAHEDWSKFLEQKGIDTTVVTAGRNKAEFHDVAPLSDDAKTRLQSMVDQYMRLFVADVAAGRGVPAKTVRSADWGEGRVLTATEAADVGMVDRVDTLNGTIERALRGEQPASQLAAATGWRPLRVRFAGELPASLGNEHDDVEEEPDDEPTDPPPAAYIDGAERLLSRSAVRAAITHDEGKG